MKKILKKLQYYFTLGILMLVATNRICAQEINYPEDIVILLGEYYYLTLEVMDEDWSIDAVYDVDNGVMLEDFVTIYNTNTRKKKFTIRLFGFEIGFFVKKLIVYTSDSKGNSRTRNVEIGFSVKKAKYLPFFVLGLPTDFYGNNSFNKFSASSISSPNSLNTSNILHARSAHTSSST